MKNWIDISTEDKRKEVYNIFDKMESKADIYRYYGVSAGPSNIEFLDYIAREIGFDFKIYKERKKRYCLQCGKELIRGQKKFCSSSCSAKYNNVGRIHSKETKRKIAESMLGHSSDKDYGEKYCKNCGKPLNKREKEFCNNDCYQEYYYKQRVQDWKEHPENYEKENLPNFIRRYLITKYGGCQLCGWNKINPVTNTSPLEIHHIDGNCLNNKEENLQLLCPNCHSLTPNDGSLNLGNSKRYKLKELRKKYNS